MKLYQIISVSLLAAAIASCGGETNPALEKLNARRDSLKEIRSDVDEQLAEIEEQIAKIDSTVDRKLVTTITPESGTFKHYFEVYGSVQSDKAAMIYAESTGAVRQISVTEGQEVLKGQVLITQDGDILDRNLAELQTQLDLASTLFEKQDRLWKQNIGSEVQYLEAKNRKEGVENQVATLKEQRGRSVVRAPFDGVVDKIYPKIGELVGMQSPMVRLVNLDKLYVTADVSERYVNQLAEGDSVSIIVNRKDTLKSTISRIGKFINPNNRSFEVRVDLKTDLASLRPNSLVALKINDLTEEQAVYLPSSVVMQDGKGADYVFVATNAEGDEMKVEKRPIKSGISYQGKTVVVSGLKADEKIIDKGSRTVRDGDKIEITSI